MVCPHGQIHTVVFIAQRIKVVLLPGGTNLASQNIFNLLAIIVS